MLNLHIPGSTPVLNDAVVFWAIALLQTEIGGILPKGPYPTCLRMADRDLLAGYPRNEPLITSIKFEWKIVDKMGPKTFINLKAWKLLLG